MSFDITTLEPHIRNILSAPGTDLSTISAKNVRRKLLELDPTLTPELLKEYKPQLDAVIGKVFEAVSRGEEETPEDPKRKREDGTDEEEEEQEEEDDDDEAPSPPPKKPKKTKRELSDAELARQLSSEINGRASRQRNGSTTKKGSSAKPKAAKNGKKVKKSADFIDTDESGDEDGDGSAKKKKTKTARKRSTGGGGGGPAKGGFAKEYSLSYVSSLSSPLHPHLTLAFPVNPSQLSSPPTPSPGPKSSSSSGNTSRVIICKTHLIRERYYATMG